MRRGKYANGGPGKGAAVGDRKGYRKSTAESRPRRSTAEPLDFSDQRRVAGLGLFGRRSSGGNGRRIRTGRQPCGSGCVGGTGGELTRRGGSAGRQHAHALLELEQLLIGVHATRCTLELLELT